jgi:hypothetical protein
LIDNHNRDEKNTAIFSLFINAFKL